MTYEDIDKLPALDCEIPDVVRGILGNLAFWMHKSYDGFKPPEAGTRASLWTRDALQALAAGKKVPIPDDLWAYPHPDEGSD